MCIDVGGVTQSGRMGAGRAFNYRARADVYSLVNQPVFPRAHARIYTENRLVHETSKMQCRNVDRGNFDFLLCKAMSHRE